MALRHATQNLEAMGFWAAGVARAAVDRLTFNLKHMGELHFLR